MNYDSTHNRVTVLMPVYNGEQHLDEAIESILAQTFTDFEFLIVNDGSTDRSAEVIGAFRDPRIRLVHNETNLGLIATLNRGLELAAGEYVCRMDQDDISLTERIACQVAFMESHPDIAVCGTWIRKFGVGNTKVCRHHGDPKLLQCGLLFGPILAHPTVMFRRKLFIDNGLYYDMAYQQAEDYELWVRAAQRLKMGNIPEVLLNYRLHPTQISSVFNAQQLETAGRVRLSILNNLGLNPSTSDFETHQRLSAFLVNGDRDFFSKADDWLCRLKEANDKVKVYSEPHFSMVLTERLVTLLKKMLEQKTIPKGFLLRPNLFQMTGLGWVSTLRFILQTFRGEVVIKND